MVLTVNRLCEFTSFLFCVCGGGDGDGEHCRESMLSLEEYTISDSSKAMSFTSTLVFISIGGK